MKYLLSLMLLCLLGACSDKDPLFKKDQIVRFKVPTFYALACEKMGTIHLLNRHPYGVIYYNISTVSKNDHFCPDLDIAEKDITAK